MQRHSVKEVTHSSVRCSLRSKIREQQFNQNEYQSQERRSLPVFLPIIGSINEKRLLQAGNLRKWFIFKIKPREIPQ